MITVMHLFIKTILQYQIQHQFKEIASLHLSKYKLNLENWMKFFSR